MRMARGMRRAMGIPRQRVTGWRGGAVPGPQRPGPAHLGATQVQARLVQHVGRHLQGPAPARGKARNMLGGGGAGGLLNEAHPVQLLRHRPGDGCRSREGRVGVRPGSWGHGHGCLLAPPAATTTAQRSGRTGHSASCAAGGRCPAWSGPGGGRVHRGRKVPSHTRAHEEEEASLTFHRLEVSGSERGSWRGRGVRVG